MSGSPAENSLTRETLPPRRSRAKVRATGIDGQVFEIEGEALMASCLLHEYDHLTGKLPVDSSAAEAADDQEEPAATEKRGSRRVEA
ncbi:MAG TPA: peptide deformylase [Kofleriaceae bacterium]|jgi:peptide deformylase|nr:peptide deformylase [Kofleriaceae bacterium]